MDSLHIERLDARYHLPPSRLSSRERLDRLLRASLDQALTLALDRVGIMEHETLCLRYLHVPVRINLAESDAAFIHVWSESFAKGIRKLLDADHGEGVLLYRSRAQALLDFATSVARGKLEHAWAWRQMGLATIGQGDSEAEVVAELVRCLANERLYIVPVMRSLARLDYLHRLAVRISGRQWQMLAHNALSGMGVGDRLQLDESLIRQLRESISGRNYTATPSEVTHSKLSQQLRERSLIAQSMMHHPQAYADDPIGRFVQAVFVVLEVEPMLLRGDHEEALRILIGLSRSMPPVAQHRARDESLFAHAEESHDASHEISTNHEKLHGRGDATDHGIDSVATNNKAQVDSRQSGFARRPPAGDVRGKYDVESSDAAPFDLRSQGRSHFGGLLLLLPLIERLGIPQQIVRHPALKQRSMRGVLQRLACALIDVDGNDAAVLAFCGLPPDADPSWSDETPWTEMETALISAWRRHIADTLRELLNRGAASGEKILHEVCRRRARIVTDPGWFEIWFSLDDVRTDFRRVGLDLDPGYLPWLGVVMKFFYE